MNGPGLPARQRSEWWRWDGPPLPVPSWEPSTSHLPANSPLYGRWPGILPCVALDLRQPLMECTSTPAAGYWTRRMPSWLAKLASCRQRPNGATELWDWPPGWTGGHNQERRFNVIETWMLCAVCLQKWEALAQVAWHCVGSLFTA
eukprot:5727204-Amphidinium_carterae.1